MFCKFDGPKWVFSCLFVAFLSISVCDATMAQTNNVDPCKTLPDNMAKIAAALDICQEVSRLNQRQPLTEEQLRQDPILRADSEKVENAIAMAPQIVQQGRLAIAALDKQHSSVKVDWLKASA